MSDFEFTPLSPSCFDELSQWHKDPELQKRYGGGQGAPKRIYDHMMNDPNRVCFVVSKETINVGYVDFEVDPKVHVGHVGLVVRPSLRGQGYGKRILEDFCRSPQAKSVSELRAGIEKDNIASIRCFKSVGFRQLSDKPDHEGCFNFSYVPHV